MSSKTKSTEMKEESTPALLPKLRFQEFRGSEEWNATPLGELGAIVTGKTPSTKEDDLWGGEILFITPTDITEGEKYQHTTQRTVVETIGTKVLAPGSVVYTCIASIGKMAVTVVPSVTNQQINAIVPNGKMAREFIYYSLANLTPWIKSIPATSTLPIINKTQFSGFIIPHPEDKAEQQKIAECLSSLDELIAAQVQKVDALKNHKKGLMQQLFPREGETQPRLRFPEFQSAGEWVAQRLDELAHYENGKAHENNISENGRYIVVNSKFISTEGEVRKFSNEGFCVADEGDVLMVLSDVPNGRAIAKCYFVESDNIYTVNQRICRIKPTKVHGRFLFYVLDRNSYFLNFDDGIKQTNLRKEDVVGFPFCVPPQPAEQQRIASCLTTLDALIIAEIQKLAVLKTHKKGLMQQLFPSPDEVEA